MSQLVWLASYPKSGNTWMRIFLINFLLNTQTPQDINALDMINHAGARFIFDDLAGFPSSHLTFDETDNLRPLVFRQESDLSPTLKFLKAHDAYMITPSGEPLFPVDATYGAIYIIRNPLDVAVSYAHHEKLSIDRIIDRMCYPEAALSIRSDRYMSQIRQKLLTWSDNVRSWLNAPGLRLHVVRYEDMLTDAERTFTEIIRFLNLPDDADRIRRAIQFSSFDEVRKQESEKKFSERMHQDAAFFRKGKAGSWEEELTPEQANRIREAHGDVMRQFGYL
jgi:hypothetical protein